MPTLDLKNRISSTLAFRAAITASATVNGPVIDTKDMVSIAFMPQITAYTAGNVTISIWHNDANSIVGATQVTTTTQGSSTVTLSALTAATGTALLSELGAFGTKRYVFIQGVGDASANLTLNAILTYVPINEGF